MEKLSVVLTKEQAKKLRNAKKRGKSMSRIVRMALDYYFGSSPGYKNE